MKRVLFYGSIARDNKDTVEKFLKEFIGKLLDDDYTIFTREGTSTPEAYEKIWLDNMVLDIACDYRDTNRLSYDRVASFVMTDDDNISKHRRQRRIISSTNRFDGYQEMMEQCDVIVSIGGTEGVYRLGLFSAAKKKLFVPIAIDNGTSRKLVKELKDYLSKHFDLDIALKGEAYFKENNIKVCSYFPFYINSVLDFCSYDKLRCRNYSLYEECKKSMKEGSIEIQKSENVSQKYLQTELIFRSNEITNIRSFVTKLEVSEYKLKKNKEILVDYYGEDSFSLLCSAFDCIRELFDSVKINKHEIFKYYGEYRLA